MNHIGYQLKQAWVGLVKNKGFFATVVSTLGITLGALLCILTLAYVLIFKPLPYPEQQALYQLNSVIVDKNRGEIARAYNNPSLIQLFDSQTLFSRSALIRYENSVLSSQPTQPTVQATYVTPGWFTMLNSEVALGRTFEQTEAKGSFSPVAILSFELWSSEFNRDRAILEKSVSLGGTSFRVIGVLAETFIEPQLSGFGVNTDIFLPWDYNSHNLDAARRENFGAFSRQSRFVGKLDSKISISQAEQTLTTPFNSYWKENISDIPRFKSWSMKMELQPFKNAILGDSANTVLLLSAGVIGLMLIACANISNLFMSRTAEQKRELAIQAAVGASKGHLFQTLLAQSSIVVFISMAVALIVARGGFWILHQYLALRLPRVDELAINGVTFGFTVLIALLLGLFFSRLSVNMINYRVLNSMLQSSGKGTGIQISKTVRRWLVISQVTIVTLLVFFNMVLLRDSLKIIDEPLGFETENISTLALKVNFSNDVSEEERKPLMLELKNKLLSLPQVEDIAQGVSPLNVSRSIIQKVEATEERSLVRTSFIDDRYLQMIEQPLVEGDFFSAEDFKDENELMIINDVYAAKLLADTNGSVLGSKISIVDTHYTVSGVVSGVKMPTETDIPMHSYLLTTQADSRFLIKLKPNQDMSREMVISMLQEVSGQLDLLEIKALGEQRDQLLFTQYTTAITSAVLAVLTLFLASIGLYGILNYATQMRRFELGTRLAIGAKRMDVLGLIIKENAGSVGIGIVISLIAMLALYIGFSDALVSYINPQLIILFIVTLMLISIMTLFACYWPLRSIINYPVIRTLRGSQ